MPHRLWPSVGCIVIHIFRNKAKEIIIIRFGHDYVFFQYHSIGNNDDGITKKLANTRGFIYKIGTDNEEHYDLITHFRQQPRLVLDDQTRQQPCCQAESVPALTFIALFNNHYM